MKNLFLLFVMLPVFCSAQNFYLQAGAGCQFASSNSKNGYAFELSSGIKFNPFFRLGIGVSYLKEDQAYTSGYIPVYADIKLIGKGKIKPYIFLQPGYGIYKSPTIYFTDFNGDLIGTGHTMGGFSLNQGIGLIYKYAFLQAGYRIQNYSLKNPDNITDSYSQNTFGITAGLALPW
ncbi:MAG TPA: outer membrane beta-barrel protein [Puia sp.]